MATVLAEAIGAGAGAALCARVAWAIYQDRSAKQRRIRESWRRHAHQQDAQSRKFHTDYRARKLLTTPAETWVREAEAKFDADREYRARMSRIKRR